MRVLERVCVCVCVCARAHLERVVAAQRERELLLVEERLDRVEIARPQVRDELGRRRVEDEGVALPPRTRDPLLQQPETRA